jgi:uncharacterized delta-60 repeat protein
MGARLPRRVGVLGASLLFFGMLAVPDGLAVSGRLDHSFSSDGKTTTDFGEYSDSAEDVDVLASGKVLVTGASYTNPYNDFAVARYRPNGTLDDGFSGDGRRLINIGNYDYGVFVSGRQNGKIVVGGYTDGVGPTVARLKPGGGLDDDFGGGDGIGEIMPGMSAYTSGGTNAGDKIVLVGSIYDVSDYQFFVARFTAGGMPDTSFGAGDGWVQINFPGTDYGDARDAVSLPNGKLLVTGSASTDADCSDFATVRLEEDGDVDTNFGNGGYRRVDFFDRCDNGRSIGLQDGHIVLGGDADNAKGNERWALTRLEANGDIDHGFGKNGRVTTDLLTDDDDEIRGLDLQPNGKIVAGGRYDSDGHMVVMRYRANGGLDHSFGNRGKTFVKFANGSEVDGLDLREGKVVVVGDVDKSPPPGSMSNDYADFGVARLLLN